MRIVSMQVSSFTVLSVANLHKRALQQCTRRVSCRCGCGVGMLCSNAACLWLLTLKGGFRAVALRFGGRRAVH